MTANTQSMSRTSSTPGHPRSFSLLQTEMILSAIRILDLRDNKKIASICTKANVGFASAELAKLIRFTPHDKILEVGSRDDTPLYNIYVWLCHDYSEDDDISPILSVIEHGFVSAAHNVANAIRNTFLVTEDELRKLSNNLQGTYISHRYDRHGDHIVTEVINIHPYDEVTKASIFSKRSRSLSNRKKIVEKCLLAIQCG